MDKRSEATLKRWGAGKILTDLVNIPLPGDPKSIERAKAFTERYGVLRKEINTPGLLLGIAYLFQRTWESARDPEVVGTFVDNVFAPMPGDQFFGEPALIAAISAQSASRRGKFSLEPRDLLDSLAMELLRNRKMLHKCERPASDKLPACNKFFVKTHSRDKYCPVVCREEADRDRSTAWARKHRQSKTRRTS
jgi:hypothetical protein